MDEALKTNYYALLLAIFKPKYSVEKCMALMDIKPYNKNNTQYQGA